MKFIDRKRELEDKIESLIQKFEFQEDICVDSFETWVSSLPGSVGNRRVRLVIK